MKNFFTLFVSLFICLIANQTFASHMMGMDISYTCLGGNVYHITLSFYRDCAGINAPTSATINAESASTGLTATATLNTTINGVEVSPLCASQISQSSCNGGPLPGVQQYVYEGDITLPGVAGDWIVYYEDCCRNAAITNIAAASSYGIRIECHIDNTNGLCDNSPVFTTLPVPYICANQPFNYNHGAFDIDGDSLAYTLIDPMDWLGGAPIPYIAPFSPAYPLSTTTGSVVFDPTTGQMSFTPNATQITVVAVRVDEYRNGVWVGSTTRDIQLVILNCTNQVPQVGSPTNVSGGYATGSTYFEVCPGQALSFQLQGTDPDVGQNLTVTTNLAAVIPGANVSTSGTNPVTINFNWQPSGTDTGFHSFTLTIHDDACPIQGQQIYSYQIYVLAGTSAGPDQTICGNMSAQLQATGGTVFQWTPATGLSNQNISNPIATPTVTTTYVVNSNLTGGCSNTDTMVVFVVPDFTYTVTPTLDTICLNQQSQLSIVGSAGGAPYTYSWTPAASLLGANTGTPSASPSVNTTYHVTITNYGGCTKYDSAVVVVAGIAPPLNLVATPQTICVGQTSQLDMNPVVGGNYCTPTYSIACSSGDFIDNFTFNTLSNLASGCNGSPNNYIYYVGTPTTTVNLGSTYPISMQAGASWGQGFGVWIDYNQNGSFADPGEFVYTSGISGTSLFSGNVTIPVTAIPGWTRLRVLCRYATVPGAGDYCVSGTFGECEDYDLYIDGGSLTYQWSPASSLSNPNIKNPVATPLTTTTYTLTVTSGGFCSNTDTVIVNVITNYTTSAGNDTSVCFGQSATLHAAPANNWTWTSIPAGFSSNLQNPVVTPSVVTTYVLFAQNASGCGAFDTVVVHFNQLSGLSAGVDVTICQGDTTQLASAGTWVAYSWSPALGLSNPNVANPLAFPTSTTSYILLATDANGCQGFDTMVLTVDVPLNLVMTGDTITCPGIPVNIGVDQGTTFLWSPISYVADPQAQNTTAAPMVPTTYMVAVQDQFGCYSYDSVFIDIYPPTPVYASDDQSIYLGETAILSAYMQGGVSFVWSPAEGISNPGTQSVEVSPLVTTTYTVTGTNAYGCSKTDETVVFILPSCPDILMPNTFTPNGDSYNDVIIPFIKGKGVIVEYEIYDRWGERIFYTDHPDLAWNGKLNNHENDCSSGVYVYHVVTLCEGSRHEYQGNITLLR